MLDAWRLWTYQTSSGSLAGVDGAYETARFNPNIPVGANTSYGLYMNHLPSASFQVSISDLRPASAGFPTEIQFFPIVVTVASRKSVRILAPSGYQWYFEQYEFLYKARASGVLESQILDGV